MGIHGIDVSSHQGDINWDKISSEVSFVMIRAGYGTSIDDKAIKNIIGCIMHKIPFGLYWFSYALDEYTAIKEATMLCDLADNYHPDYPLAYDWEYASDDYAKKMKADTSKRAMLAKARAFMNTVKSRGHYPMLYTNLDYLNRGFGELTNEYDIWLAHWGVSAPSVTCGIWQTTNKGKVSGVNTQVDFDICYKDYPAIIKGNNKNEYQLTSKLKETITERITNAFWEKYTALANAIIRGEYGTKNTNPTRKQQVEAAGYNYDIAQIFVTAFLGE